jgi:hypothetical protein
MRPTMAIPLLGRPWCPRAQGLEDASCTVARSLCSFVGFFFLCPSRLLFRGDWAPCDVALCGLLLHVIRHLVSGLMLGFEYGLVGFALMM